MDRCPSRCRHVLQQALGGAALAGLFLRPNIAGAFPFGDEVGDTLDSIAKDRAKVEEVLVLLKKKELRANADDSAVIFRYIGSVYQPLQGGDCVSSLCLLLRIQPNGTRCR